MLLYLEFPEIKNLIIKDKILEKPIKETKIERFLLILIK